MICGMTESGKTSLAKILAREIKERGYRVIVLDPLQDPEWPADYQTDDPDKFVQVAKQNIKCLLIVDEAGDSVGQYDKTRFWLATRARHWGHTTFFLAQRAQMIARTVRDQCGVAYLFKMSLDDAKLMSNEFAREELKNINNLGQFEFYYVTRFGGFGKYRVDIVQKSYHPVREK
jgi:hypothetical protein